MSTPRLLALAALTFTLTAPAQSPAPPPKPLTFDVVSIKPNHSLNDNRQWGMSTDGFKATAVSVRELIGEAYSFNIGPLTDEQVLGAPGWAQSDKFDIQAKVDSADIPRLEQTHGHAGMLAQLASMQNHIPTARMLLLQTLLTERFHLKLHHETRQLPVYVLTVAKDGPRIKPLDTDNPTGSNISFDPGVLTVKAAPIAFIANVLAQQAGRIVIDKTSLPGYYDLTLKWTPDGPASPDTDTSAPSLFTALQEQLGLKLEATKAPIDVLIIDHLDKPTAN